MNEEIMTALYRKAVGGSVTETSQEFGGEGCGELLRRRETEKYYPPDVAALKAYLELTGGDDILSLSDEKLEEEIKRIRGELGARGE